MNFHNFQTQLRLFNSAVILITILLLSPALSAATNCATQGDIPPTECQALLDLYNNTTGTGWTDSATNNWNVTTTPCSWTGVTCGGGHVTQIDRYSENLTGTLPLSLNVLTGLTYLRFSNNHLSGTIPSLPASLITLYLDGNSLSGNIPPLPASLTDLRLYTNSLTGTIPSLPTGLTIIDLHVNSLSGSIPSLPTGLTYLDLSNNSLSGSIPSLPAGLTYLLLPKNKLSGTLPSFASLTSLTLPYHLDLGYNALTSAAPGEDALVLSKQSNWKDTQTVAPAPVVVTPSPVVTILPVTIVSANFSCATTGDIGEVCNYSGREVTDLNVQETSSVSNGVVLATVVNQGWVSNFHITATGKLSGGVVTGYIVNEGVMQDFKFVGMSILGGTLGGVITNNSRVGGYFQNVTLLPNTKITGGILRGIITGDKNAPALLENVRVKGRSKLSGVKLGKNVKLEKGVLLEDK